MQIPKSLQSMYAPLTRPPKSERPLHIVLICTGSVASVKIPLIVEELLCDALHFFDREKLPSEKLSVENLADMNKAAERQSQGHTCPIPDAPRFCLWTDIEEWTAWKSLGDPVLHIELRRWADLVLIAPCSANTLAKIANGLCDNLATSFLRALSPDIPTWLYPAMNTLMYMHPHTADHLSIVQDKLHYEVRGPIEKRLACGDLGTGAMQEWTQIVKEVAQAYHLQRSHTQKSG